MIVGRAIAFFVVVVLCVYILVAFVQLQIYEHESYQSRSDKNHTGAASGLIYDTNGILLADNRPSSQGIVVSALMNWMRYCGAARNYRLVRQLSSFTKQKAR